MRVLTYNIHKCIGGVDRRYDPHRVARTIAHYDPDILLLQEVDDGVPRSRGDRQVDWLGDELGYAHRAFQANVQLKQGSYGNAILSRHAIESIEHVDLTIPLKKRRQALVVRIDVRVEGHSHRWVVANVHLGLAGFERSVQVRRLLQNGTLQSTRKSTPTIIGGDFNDGRGALGPKLLAPLGYQSVVGNGRTFPAIYPVRTLDRIFYRGNVTLDLAFGGHTKLARHASDHLPVIADFQMP
jgi:endonuclease/exonuclease/phosphatase family metal-dependent hydrolase